MTPDSIRAHQDGIYTVCLHVLRHPQDAEDAAQEALLKIASEAGGIRDPRAFKSWLYRVTYRTAVDHLRKRATRRRIEEGSVPMIPSLTEEQREAIHEAMAALPDDDRLLLVEHYFEMTTLEELGRREGISDVAMGKRVDKAREKLKRGLAGAGILIAASQVTHALENVQTAAAPPGIISKAALAAAGEAAMGTATKGIGVAVVLVLLLLLGGTAYLLRRTDSPAPAAGVQAPSAGAPNAAAAPSATLDAPRKGDPARGDLATCRRLLSRRLSSVRHSDVVRLASAGELIHSGGLPWFETLAKEFAAASGPDFLSIARTLLADTESDAAKFILATLLGRSRLPEAVDALKALTSDGTSPWVTQSVLYSIGIIRSPEGFAFLQSYWERIKATEGPLPKATLQSLALFGPEAIPLLAAEAKSQQKLFRDRADYLGSLRGDDCTDALLALLETEEDGAVREGAGRAISYNLTSKNLPTILATYEATADPKVKSGILYGLVIVQRNPALWESTFDLRKEFASRVVQNAVFPTGTLNLDRALIHLGALASPESSERFLLKFEGLDRETAGGDYDIMLREILSAYSKKPGFEERLTSLMSKAGMTAEDQERMRAGGLMKSTPDLTPANTRILLDTLRTAKPGEPSYEIAIQALSRPGSHESAWSRAMLEAYEACATEKDRLSILDNLLTVLYGKRERLAGIPEGFLATVLNGPSSVDTKIQAAYVYLGGGTDRDLDPQARKQIADLIGPSMKWAIDSTLPVGDFRMIQLAPSVLGDYYARFGTAADAAWLQKMPDEFPYPAVNPKVHKIIRDELTRETRRAIDAIRLRN